MLCSRPNRKAIYWHVETLTLLISEFEKSRDLFQGEHMHCLANKLGFTIC